MKDSVSYYDVLNVPRTASAEEIKQAYRKLAKQHHPDHNPNMTGKAQDRLRQLNEAYSKLKKSETRAQYDAELNQRHWRAHIHQRPSQNDNITGKEIQAFPWEELARVGWVNMMDVLKRPALPKKDKNNVR